MKKIIIIVLILIIAVITTYTQINCDDKLVNAADSIAGQININVLGNNSFTVKTETGEEISAYYINGEIAKLTVIRVSKGNIDIYFSGGWQVFCRQIEKPGESGTVEKFYFSTGNLSCWINNDVKHPVDTDFYNIEKILKAQIDKYLAAIQ